VSEGGQARTQRIGSDPGHAYCSNQEVVSWRALVRSYSARRPWLAGALPLRPAAADSAAPAQWDSSSIELSASMYASIDAAMMFVLRDEPVYSPSPRAPSAAAGGRILTVTSGSNVQSRGAVVIEAGDHHWKASSQGNGAVDALFEAVDKALAEVLAGHPRLVGYDVHALAEGPDAEGLVTAVAAGGAQVIATAGAAADTIAIAVTGALPKLDLGPDRAHPASIAHALVEARDAARLARESLPAELADSLEYAIWKSGAELRRRDERHFTTTVPGR